MRVFLSSTYEDLIDYRLAVTRVLETLDNQVGRMEVFGARPDTPAEMCRAELAKCEYFIGIYAHRYGSIHVDSGVSFVEDELLHARGLNKIILCFVVQEDHPWIPKWVDDEPGKSRLRKLIAKVGNWYGVERFTTPEVLATKVMAALTRLVMGHVEQSRHRSDLLQQILKTRKLSVGLFNYNPFINFDVIDRKCIVQPGNGGLYVNMLTKIAERNALDVHFHPLKNVKEAVPYIIDGKLNCVICIFVSNWRMRHADFCAILHEIDVCAIVPSAQKFITKVEDLLDPKVKLVVHAGEIGEEYVDHVMGIDRNRVTFVESDLTMKAASHVQPGDCDIAIMDSISITDFIKQRGRQRPRLQLIFRNPPLMTCGNGTMIPKNQPAFAAWLDREFAAVRDQPDIKLAERAILKKYKGLVRRVEVKVSLLDAASETVLVQRKSSKRVKRIAEK